MIIDKNTVMLFQGDSITDGNRTRNTDRNHIMGHGYQNLIASKIGAKYYKEMPRFINRGVSGDSIEKIAARWQAEAVMLEPTVINILAGVNDILVPYNHKDGKVGTPADKFDRVYRDIIDDTLEQLPDVRFVLFEPFYSPWRNDELSMPRAETVKSYAEKVEKICNDYGFIFIPLQKMFDEYSAETDPEYLIWDEVHPTIFGHQLIADKWFEVMKEKGELSL